MKPTTITVTTATMAILNLFNYAVLWDKQSWRERDVIILFIATTLVIAIGFVVLWFYYQGRNWARWAVIFASLLILLNNYEAIRDSNAIVKVVDAAEMIVAIFLVFWLNTSTAKVYFKRESSTQLA